ncbi:hypothetical protein EZS27_042214, partial [termite gut metagenome]
LKPIDQSEDKPGEKQGNTSKATSIPQEKKELTTDEKALQDIHDLMSGKLNVNDYNRICEKANNTSPQIPGRLQEYKEAMGDRLIIGSVPKYENQSKGFKL